MSSLTIVVPRLGRDIHFENTLASILRYRMPHHQVIVIQSDLQADTYGLEGEVTFVEVAGKPRLGRYLNQVLDVASGETIHIVRPGVEVTHQWFAHGIRQLQDPRTGCVASSLVAASNRDEIVSCGITVSRTMLPRHSVHPKQTPLGPSCWAAFYRRSVLEAVGELDESIDDNFLGLDLALSIRSLGMGCAVVRDRILTIASREMLQLPMTHQTGCNAQRMIQRHVDKENQQLGSLVAICGDVLTSFWKPTHWTRIAGRFSARNKRATDRGFQRRLAVARHQLADPVSLPGKRQAA